MACYTKRNGLFFPFYTDCINIGDILARKLRKSTSPPSEDKSEIQKGGTQEVLITSWKLVLHLAKMLQLLLGRYYVYR